MKLDTSGASAACTYRLDTAGLSGGITMAQRQIFRFNMKWTDFPAADLSFIATKNGGFGNYLGLYYETSDSSVRTIKTDWLGGTVVAGASGVVISLDTEYLIDVDLEQDANPWTADAKVNGTSVAQVTSSEAAATPSDIYVGWVASGQATLILDDMVVSQTTADYPIGAGEVYRRLPATPDGDHNVSGSNFLRNAAGAAIADSDTDVYTLLDEVPLGGGSDFVNQAANASGEYVAINFENTPSGLGAPRGLDVIVARHEFGTGSGNSQHRLRDTVSAAEDTFLSFSGAGSTSLRYVRKCYATAPGGAAWTSAIFDGLVYRFGYSSDANPDQYSDGAMLEVEYAPATPTDEDMALATATAAMLALTVKLSEAMGLITATAEGLGITANIQAVMAAKTANAAHPDLTVKLSESMGLKLASAEHLALTVDTDALMALAASTASYPDITAHIQALMASKTAAAAHLDLTVSFSELMAAALADAVHLTITAHIQALMTGKIATAEHLALTVDSDALMALATATAAHLDITAHIQALMTAKTASAAHLDLSVTSDALMALLTAVAEHLAITVTGDTGGGQSESMAVMVADAIALAITANTQASMAAGTADAILLANTASIQALMGASAASAEHLSLTAGIAAAMTVLLADAVLLANTVNFSTAMATLLADASMPSIVADIEALMGLSTADAALLVITVLAALVVQLFDTIEGFDVAVSRSRGADTSVVRESAEDAAIALGRGVDVALARYAGADAALTRVGGISD